MGGAGGQPVCAPGGRGAKENRRQAGGFRDTLQLFS
jgi:hypothetical protein